MKKYLLVITLVSVLFTGWIYYLNKCAYVYPNHDELDQKIKYLEWVVDSPIQHSAINSLQVKSKEWVLFTLSYSCYALTNCAYLDSTFKQRAVQHIDKAIQQAMSSQVSRYFTNHNPCLLSIDSNASVLYIGHLNLMIGCYRKLTRDTKYDKLNEVLSLSLYNRFCDSKFMCLESYPGHIWIPDNTVAIASLRLYEQYANSPTQIRKLCDNWILFAKNHFIDNGSLVLCSKISTESGEITEEPRGSMLGWSILYLYRIDTLFAKEQYTSYKEGFGVNIGYTTFFRERQNNRESDRGDIDSGPIVLGFSIPATSWAFGNAVAMQDLYTAQSIKRAFGLGSTLVESEHGMYYKTRFIDESYSPLSEALLLSLETMTSWR